MHSDDAAQVLRETLDDLAAIEDLATDDEEDSVVLTAIARLANASRHRIELATAGRIDS